MDFDSFKWTSKTGLYECNSNSCQKFAELLIIYLLLELLRETYHQWIFVAVFDKTSDIIRKSARIKPFEALFRINQFNDCNLVPQVRPGLPLCFNTVKRMFNWETNRYPCHPYTSCLQIEPVA